MILLPHALRGGAVMKLAPFSRPGVLFLFEHYRFLVDFLAVPMVALVLALCLRLGARQSIGRICAPLRTPAGIVILLLLLVPAFAMLLAVFGSGLSHPRYALFFTLAASVVVGFLLHELRLSDASEQRVASIIVIVTMSGCIVRAMRSPMPIVASLESLPRSGTGRDLPIVMSDPAAGLQAWYLADESLRQRVVIAADPACAVKYRCTATPDINLQAARQFFVLPVETWEELRVHHPQFILVETDKERRWLPRQIADAGAEMTPAPAPDEWRASLIDLRRDGR
jgi:hypothetical protein